MKSIANDIFLRTEEVLFSDKLKAPQKVGRILSSEILYILKQYFEIAENSYSAKIFMESNGDVSFNLSFKAKRVLIKRAGEVLQ